LKFREKTFEKLFNLAEIASYGKVELSNYQNSLKVHNDLVNSLDFAEEKGIEKGIVIGEIREREKNKEKQRKRNLDLAKTLKDEGTRIEIIVKATGLTEEQIKSL
jgi:predicted transposase/invertase (TIGR01784 family)